MALTGKKGPFAVISLPKEKLERDFEKCLKIEFSKETGISVRSPSAKGKSSEIEIVVNKGDDTWATFRSKVNTVIRSAETVRNAIKAVSEKKGK